MSRPLKPEDGWPINHTNAGSAAFTKLADSPGINQSYYLTGFILSGGGDANGFSILRRMSVLLAAGSDTIIFGDNAALEPVGGDATIEFGIKTSDVSLSTMIFKTTGTPINGYNIEIDSAGKLVATFGDGTHTASITSRNPINDGRWHHVIINYEYQQSNGINLYIDGGQAATSVSNASIGACTGGASNLVLLGSDNKDVYLSTIGIYKGGIVSDSTIAARAGVGGLGESGACGSKFTGSESNLTFAANLDEGTGSGAGSCKDLVGSVDGDLTGTWTDGEGIPIDPHTLKETIKYNTGKLNTQGVIPNTPVVFPHDIKIGRNNPIRINETDGDFELQLFGYSDRY
jgi:hypothetical protein